jgi:hypothetical protein
MYEATVEENEDNEDDKNEYPKTLHEFEMVVTSAVCEAYHDNHWALHHTRTICSEEFEESHRKISLEHAYITEVIRRLEILARFTRDANRRMSDLTAQITHGTIEIMHDISSYNPAN